MPLKNPSHFTLPLYPRYRGVGLSGRSRGGGLGIGPKCILHWAFLARFVVFKDHNRSLLILQRGEQCVHATLKSTSILVVFFASLVERCFSEDSVCQVKASLWFIHRLFLERQLLLIKNVVMLWPLQTKLQSSPLCESHVSFNSGKASLWGLGRSHVIVISKLLYYITIFNLQICTGTECTKARLITEPLASAVVQLEWIHGGIAHSQNTCEQAFGLRSAW